MTAYGSPSLPLDDLTMLFCMAFLCYGLVSGTLRIARPMYGGIGALLLVALIMPPWFMGGWLANVRMPVALAFVLVGATELVAPKRALIVVCGLAALALLGTRITAVSLAWHELDRMFAEFRAASTVITPGSRVLVVESKEPFAATQVDGISRDLAIISPPQFWHMPALAVIDRSAFIPYLFTELTTIEPAERNSGLSTVGTPVPPDVLYGDWRRPTRQMPLLCGKPPAFADIRYAEDWQHKYDYVLWIDFGQPPQSPPENLNPAARGSFFTLYRVAS